MIMINSTQVSYFTFINYFDIGLLKYFAFVITMCYYAVVICANVLLVTVICLNRSLHEPMYLFLCSLFINELHGSTGLFPFLLVQILSDVHTISAPLCFLQIFCLYNYVNTQFFNLAMMAYDRYVAICYPLQYNSRMTRNKATLLIVLTWLLPLLHVIIMISLSASLQLCGNIIYRLICTNYSIVKLACYDTTVNNVYGLVYTFTVFVGLAILIIYSYMKILNVCFSGSKETRQKAVSTCTPHLASLINFSCGCFWEIILSRLDMNSVPFMVRMFSKLYFLVCQPLFNPLIYGLNLTKIRIICKSVVFGKM